MNTAEMNRAKTHCKHGHEFSPENTRVRENGQRVCRACCRAAVKAQKAKVRAERATGGVLGDLLAVYRSKVAPKSESGARTMLRALKDRNPKEFLAQLRAAETDARAAKADSVQVAGEDGGHEKAAEVVTKLLGEWETRT